jgi:WD40 repeat protein
MSTLHRRENYRSKKPAWARLAALLAAAVLLLALPRSAPLRAQGGAVPAAGGQPEAHPELELQIGHLGGVDSVAFSPDGKTIASGGRDYKILLWDVASGATVRVLTGHADQVTSLAWSPDGTLLVSSSPDGTIRFWNPQTGAWLRTLDSPAASITFSPDGKTLASGFGETVKLRDPQTGAELRELTVHPGSVQSLAFSPDGQRLAVGSAFGGGQHGSGELTLWDVPTGVAQWSVTLREQSRAGASVAFSPDGQMIASGGGVEGTSGDLRIWDARTGALQRSLAERAGAVLSLAFSSDGQTLVSGGFASDTVRLWDPHTGAALKTLSDPRDPPGQVIAVALSRDDRMVAAAYDGGEVKLWDAQTGVLRCTLGWNETINSVALSPDGKLIATGAGHKTVLWDAQTGALKWLPGGQTGYVNWVEFSRDSKILATASDNGSVKLWDLKTRSELRTIEGQPGWNWVVLSPDGKLLARPTPGNELSFWDVKTGEPLRTLPGHNDNPGVAFSPDGKTVATCSSPGEEARPAEIQLWDARTWQLLRALKGHTGLITGIAFSPDSTLLATGNPSVVRLWDVETGELRRTLQPGTVRSLAFSPDGKLLAMASPRWGTISLWHVATGLLLRTLTARNSMPIYSVSFSSDGQRLVSGGDDHTVKIWEVSTGRLLATLITPPPAQPGQVSSDWLAITPDGYYDSSPGAARFIQWRIGSDLFPLEAYEHTFHRPDLLRRALASQPIAVTPQLHRFAAGQAIPPQVTITRPHDGQTITGTTLRVELTVTDVRSVVRVEVRLNGRPVATKPIKVGGKPLPLPARPIQVGGKSVKLLGQPLPAGARPITVGGKPIPADHRFLHHLTAEVPLPVGETQVILKAIATDADALQGWAELHLSRPSATAADLPAAALGDLYVLSIGVSRYQNPRYNLKYAAADATAFAHLWSRMQGSLYRRVVLTPLTDAQATTANVRAALFQLLERAMPRDSVALFLSGHGVQASEGEFYFATHDIDAASAQQVKETGLPWTVFETILAKVDAKRVFLFLDACHSGSALGEQQASNERLAEALARHGNVLVFSSSRGGEYSYEDGALQHGAFTEALLEGIGEGKADLEIGGRRDGRITAAKLLAYLQARVPQLTRNQQTPTCPLLYDFGEAYLLARAR